MRAAIATAGATDNVTGTAIATGTAAVNATATPTAVAIAIFGILV